LIDDPRLDATLHGPRLAKGRETMTEIDGLEKRPLSSVDELVEYFVVAGKPANEWRLGIEHEKIGVRADGSGVPFLGGTGIEAILRALETSGYTGERESEQLLAAQSHGLRVTVEPGGQLEYSGPALETAEECRRALLDHLALVTALGERVGVRFIGVGFQPWASSEQLEWLPKRRYAVMRQYLPTRGRLGLRMMQLTATVQANLDYDTESTAVEKLRAAFGVTSIVTALFAASPFEQGRPNGYKSIRSAIWLDTDNDRCGLLPAAFEESFSFRDYAEWALDVPMFFVVRGGQYQPVAGMTFRRFMREGWRQERATRGDWEIHLSTLFPEVRLKKYIEVRGADAGPLSMTVSLGALWRGLLDDQEARRMAWRLVKGPSFAERQQLRVDVPRLAMAARFGGRSVRELAVELVELAAAGLSRLPGGREDAALLEPLRERARSGRCPADDMLDDFTACRGDPAKLVQRWTMAAPLS
jgi:glutamate--cysteine ligase